MKTILMTIAMLTAASFAQAKTVCGVSTGKNGTYDQPIYSGELSESKLALISQDGQAASELVAQDLDTLEKWKAIDGRSIMFFSKYDGGVSVGMAKVNVAAGANGGQMLEIDAMTAGPITPTSALTLLLPSKNLAGFCFESEIK